VTAIIFWCPDNSHSYLFDVLFVALYICLIFSAAVTGVIFWCPDTIHTYPSNVLPLASHYLFSLPLLSATFLWLSLNHFSGGTHCFIIFDQL